MSVFLSSGSPRRSVPIRRRSTSSNSSAMDSCTSSRDPAQHTWPWLKKIPLTIPSTAWSTGASSNTMLAALPPSSRVSRLRGDRADPGDLLADLGGAGERHLVDAGVGDQGAPGGAVAGDDVDHARGAGRPAGRSRRTASAVSGVVSAGLSTTVLPQASAGAIFQASISSGKFHGMTWPATPSGRGVGPNPAYSQLVGPARVVEEVRRGQRDVDVARLADRLAVVERLQHGELAGTLLDQPGDPEQVLAPLLAGHDRPGPLVGRGGRRPPPGQRRPGPPR